MVDDGAEPRAADDVHGDELRAEGEHVQLGPHRSVGLGHLLDGPALDPPSGELEHWRPVLLRSQS